MKKNYTSPVVEVNAFDFEDVVMTSSADPTPTPGNPSVGAGSTVINDFKGAVGTTGIVVEW